MDGRSTLQTQLHNIASRGASDGEAEHVAAQVVRSNDREAVEAFLDYVAGNVPSAPSAKSLLQAYVQAASELPSADAQQDLLELALGKASVVGVRFETELCVLRERLADALLQLCRHMDAYKCLMGMPLDTMAEAERARIYVRVMTILLESGDPATADSVFKHASIVKGAADEPIKFELQLLGTQTLEALGNFTDASMRYYRLSLDPVAMQSGAVRQRVFSRAIECAMLCPVGQHRSAILGILVRDGLASSSPLFSILIHAYKEQFIGQAEASMLADALARARTARHMNSGAQEVKRAITQHNLMACSKVFDALPFADLADMLEISPDEVEQTFCEMIAQGRLAGGHVDQPERVIVFQERLYADPYSGAHESIKTVCHLIEDTASMV